MSREVPKVYQGVLLISDPDEIVEKIRRHNEALAVASLPHEMLMRATELIGTLIAPALRDQLGRYNEKNYY